MVVIYASNVYRNEIFMAFDLENDPENDLKNKPYYFKIICK